MHNEEDFEQSIKYKKIPILVLDQKWHRLFAVHGKTEEIKDAEAEVSGHLARQGKLTNDLKDYRNLKKKLMSSIVENMDGANEAVAESAREKTLDENARRIDELNEKIDACEEELLEIPALIKESNERLMILSMDYFYSKLRVNQSEAKEIEDWITQVRIDLKKNIIRKQNREINNREIYAYLHDILGPEIIDLFDLQYDNEPAEADSAGAENG